MTDAKHPHPLTLLGEPSGDQLGRALVAAVWLLREEVADHCRHTPTNDLRRTLEGDAIMARGLATAADVLGLSAADELHLCASHLDSTCSRLEAAHCSKAPDDVTMFRDHASYSMKLAPAAAQRALASLVERYPTTFESDGAGR